MHKYVRWNGEKISKEFTMSPFHDHFPFDWPLEILYYKFPNGHALPQDRAINKINLNINYKLYGLPGVTN